MAVVPRAGVAALVLAERPGTSAEALRDLLCDSARDLGLPDAKQGGGLVDAADAVETA